MFLIRIPDGFQIHFFGYKLVFWMNCLILKYFIHNALGEWLENSGLLLHAKMKSGFRDFFHSFFGVFFLKIGRITKQPKEKGVEILMQMHQILVDM